MSTQLELPYPGLRPFQPEDSEYFFGRDEQIEEVLWRLRASRFVAVIGGSGSGKSSLVLAGAIPRLRTYAIEGAGDFWVPIVCTPGTDLDGSDSPIERLARKFCALLKGCGGPEAEARRYADCAGLLRERQGLDKLVGKYGRDLNDTDGVDLSNTNIAVNYLFLIDQFEEIFHPTNQEPCNRAVAEDCAHLVARLVERFESFRDETSTSPLCVAITMRSEHLNDCTRYPGLPDAINATFYLNQRMDGDQLKDAIERPAMRYVLKLQMRAARDKRERRHREQHAARPAIDGAVEPGEPMADANDEALPDRILFEPALTERLLADASVIRGQREHADQLALLQHMLFWLWDAASVRWQKEKQGAVRWLTLADLETALAGNTDSAARLRTSLEQCLENRCEAIFNASPGLAAEWENVFRRLAFKEPMSGMYSQQRFSVAKLAGQLGEKEPGALLGRLGPWIVWHPYLCDRGDGWLKIAHETLIRRWSRFRAWIDDEDREFQKYTRLLDDCAQWIESGCPVEKLIDAHALQRFDYAGLVNSLRDTGRYERFADLLAMVRHRRRRTAAALKVEEFVQASVNKAEVERLRVHAAEQAQEATRIARLDAERDLAVTRANEVAIGLRFDLQQRSISMHRWAFLGVGALVIIAGFIATAETQLSDKERKIHRGYMLLQETQIALPAEDQPKTLDDFQFPLRNALTGAQLLIDGEGATLWSRNPMLPLLFQQRHDSVVNAQTLGDAGAQSGLRNVLRRLPWKVGEPAAERHIDPQADITSCKTYAFDMKDPPAEKDITTSFIFSAEQPSDNGLVVSTGEDKLVRLFAATRAEHRHCVLKKLLYAVGDPSVKVGIAGDLTNVVLDFPKGYQFRTVLWGTSPPDNLQFAERIGFDKAKAKATPDRSLPADAHRVALLRSAETSYGTDVDLGDSTWVRLFSYEPVAWRMPKDLAFEKPSTNRRARQWQALHEEQAPGNCVVASQWQGAVESAWVLPGANGAAPGFCLGISRSPEGLYAASLYRLDDSTKPGVSKVAYPELSQVSLSRKRPRELMLSPDGGWLAFRETDAGAWRAMPVAAAGWRSLSGHGVFDPATPVPGKQRQPTTMLDTQYRMAMVEFDNTALNAALPPLPLEDDPPRVMVSAPAERRR